MHLGLTLISLLICASVVNGRLNNSIARSRECTQQGPMCDDCKTLVFCVKDEDGEWDKDLVEYCENGRACLNDSPPSCSFAPNDECDMNVADYHFRCKQSGLFPHPFDCKKYYNCLLDENDDLIEEPISMECTNGYGYDSLTTTCRQTLIHGDCRKKLVQPCYNSGAIFPIEGNPYLYAVCLTDNVDGNVVYFPQIFACKNDEEFIDGACTKPETGLDSSGRCARLGFFFDPLDCKKYNECLFLGFSPTSRSCLFGYTFNKFAKVCQIFKC